MRNLLLILLLVVTSFIAEAQIAAQRTQYQFDQLSFNPAAAGKDQAIDATFAYRAQWTGITGNPSLQSFNVHSPLNVANSSAGLSILNDRLGPERTTSIMLNYAYRMSFKFGKLAFGASAGIFQRRLDGSQLRSPDGSYEGSFDHNDDFIPDQVQSAWAPEFNVGVYFHNSKLFAGVSVLNLMESKVTLDTPAGSTELRLGRAFTGLLGYKINLGKKLMLQPSVLFKSDLNQFQSDISVILDYKRNMWFGMTFRGISGDTKDALAIVLGARIKKLVSIGYSYDFSLSDLNEVNSGSHEILLNYLLNIKELVKPGKAIYNPRYL